MSALLPTVLVVSKLRGGGGGDGWRGSVRFAGDIDVAAGVHDSTRKGIADALVKASPLAVWARALHGGLQVVVRVRQRIRGLYVGRVAAHRWTMLAESGSASVD